MKLTKKTIGWALIILAILFIDPMIDFGDSVTLPLYSMYSGDSIDFGNISCIYFDYFIWCMTIGIILLLSGLYILGWDFKKLFKKLDLGNYNVAVYLSIVIVAIISYLDIQGMIYWSSFSTTQAYTSGQQGIYFWNFFKSIAFSIFLILPVTYFLLVKRDVSESIALGLSSYLIWMFGLADILYFIFQREAIPMLLPWLNNHPIIGFISNNLGFEQVTNLSLFISVMIGFIVVFLTTKVMKEKF